MCTGETASSLHPAVGDYLSRLAVEERRALVGLIDNACGSDVVDARVCRAVLPDAADVGQQELEAAVFVALGQAWRYLREHPRWALAEVIPLCRMVRPGSGSLAIHVDGRVLAPLLAELLPCVNDVSYRGVAGLRFSVNRRHIQLYLGDSRPTSNVQLSNVSFRQVSAAVSFASVVTGYDFGVNFDHPLSEWESAAIRLGRVTGAVDAASSLLRRVNLLRDASQLSVCMHNPAVVRVGWHGGRSPASVASLLAHPMIGLSSGSVELSTVYRGGSPGSCPICAPERRSLLNPRVVQAWNAFDARMAAPNCGTRKLIDCDG
jgi:hypothetical protein